MWTMCATEGKGKPDRCGLLTINFLTSKSLKSTMTCSSLMALDLNGTGHWQQFKGKPVKHQPGPLRLCPYALKQPKNKHQRLQLLISK